MSIDRVNGRRFYDSTVRRNDLATSARPCAPVLPVPQRRQYAVTRRLLGVLTGRGRSRA